VITLLLQQCVNVLHACRLGPPNAVSRANKMIDFATYWGGTTRPGSFPRFVVWSESKDGHRSPVQKSQKSETKASNKFKGRKRRENITRFTTRRGRLTRLASTWGKNCKEGESRSRLLVGNKIVQFSYWSSIIYNRPANLLRPSLALCRNFLVAGL